MTRIIFSEFFHFCFTVLYVLYNIDCSGRQLLVILCCHFELSHQCLTWEGGLELSSYKSVFGSFGPLLTIFEDASKNVPDTAPYYITTILYVHAPLFKPQKKNLLLIILEVNRIIDRRLLILSIMYDQGHNQSGFSKSQIFVSSLFHQVFLFYSK